jgi:hypothetical protein
MEGRYENFTLGRNIEMEKVKEMYRLFRKHGLQLEGLRSFGRYVSDEEVAQKRKLADDLRQHPDKLEALIAERKAAKPVPTADEGPARQVGPWLAAGVGALVVAAAWLLFRQKREG